MRRALWVAILLLAVAWGRAAPISAHAILLRSIPAADASLPAAAVERVEMWFSEPVEPSFSRARLLDINGESVPTPPAEVDPADPFHLILPVGALPPGIYTVAWQNVSQADGHEWIGSFPFTILNPDGTRPDGTVPESLVASGDETPGLGQTIARWLLLVGSMLLFGLPLFRLLVVGAPTAAGTPVDATLARLFGGGVLLAGAGVVLQTLLQAQRLGGWPTLFPLLTTTRTGQLALARLLLIVAGAAVGRLSLSAARRWQGRWLAGALLLALISAGSHAAAAPGQMWALLGDFLHLLAAAAWLSGLLVLPFAAALALREPEQRPMLAAMAGRFSTLAGGAMVVLLGTGLFSGAVQVPSLGAILGTTYGQTLLVKGVLVALVLAVAAGNRWVVGRPASLRGGGGAWRMLRWQLGWEVALALALMGIVAVLVQTPVPPRVVEENRFERFAEANGLNVFLEITPNRVGNNQFSVHLYEEDESVMGEVQQVRLFFDYQGEALGQAMQEMVPVEAPYHYSLDGSYLSQAGLWEVGVYVRRRGLDDTLVTLPVEVLPPARAATPWQNPIPQVPLPWVIALPLGLALLLAFLWRGLLARRPRSPQTNL